MSNKALMTAVGTALAVAGGLYLYYKVLEKPADTAAGGTTPFRGRKR
tara:strand:- start:53 stop:193 length:141 start_codon:yes stop_codon:yes gene_type:complete